MGNIQSHKSAGAVGGFLKHIASMSWPWPHLMYRGSRDYDIICCSFTFVFDFPRNCVWIIYLTGFSVRFTAQIPMHQVECFA